MPDSDRLTKKQAREAARKARRSAEAAERVRAERHKVRTRLALAVAAAVAIVSVAIVLSSGGSGSSDNSKLDLAIVATLFAGIPQHGQTLGSPSAPVRIDEFGDLQCPYCSDFATGGGLADLVSRWVRHGDVQITFQPVHFLGADSLPAGEAALEAAQYDRMWQFVDLFYHRQQEENSGYVTADFLGTQFDDAGVPNPDVALKAESGFASEMSAISSKWSTYHGNSTPWFEITPRGGPTTHVNVSSLGPHALDAAIGQALEYAYTHRRATSASSR